MKNKKRPSAASLQRQVTKLEKTNPVIKQGKQIRTLLPALDDLLNVPLAKSKMPEPAKDLFKSVFAGFLNNMIAKSLAPKKKRSK